MLDESLRFYLDYIQRDPSTLDPSFWDVPAQEMSPPNGLLGLARAAANSARAAGVGAGVAKSKKPNSLYSYDPSSGRTAVTTPVYSTTVMPVNEGAFPYGGIEMARLFRNKKVSVPAGNIGGRPPAAFGVVITDSAGHRVLASQVGRPHLSKGTPPLRLIDAPEGVGVRGDSPAGKAFAAPFTLLKATGVTTAAGLTERTTHTFTPESVLERWDIGSTTARRLTTEIDFPSTGPNASDQAVLLDGSVVPVSATPIALKDVAYFFVQSARSGYVVVPKVRPIGATVHTINVAPQSTEPHPGPTLEVQLTDSQKFHKRSFVVRISPADTVDEARQVAQTL
jgi:hypothetical protein